MHTTTFYKLRAEYTAAVAAGLAAASSTAWARVRHAAAAAAANTDRIAASGACIIRMHSTSGDYLQAIAPCRNGMGCDIGKY